MQQLAGFLFDADQFVQEFAVHVIGRGFGGLLFVGLRFPPKPVGSGVAWKPHRAYLRASNSVRMLNRRIGIFQTNRSTVVQSGVCTSSFTTGIVKTAVGKSIDHKNVHVLFGQPVFELFQDLRPAQLDRRFVRNMRSPSPKDWPGASCCRMYGMLSRSDLEMVFPFFAGMDVAAIGKVSVRRDHAGHEFLELSR
jgi:hypothetical protein